MFIYLTLSSGYSNYWAAMDERGYYKRHDSYYPIFRRNVTGTFEVPMIHSVVMIDMRDSRVSGLQYYPIPEEYKVKVKIVPCYFRRCGWKSFFLGHSRNIEQRYWKMFGPLKWSPKIFIGVALIIFKILKLFSG